MSLPTDTLLTPRQFVTETATLTDAIDLGQIALLGVVQSPENAAAILRHADGRIVRLIVGDHVDVWRIGAISDDRVILIRNGEASALHLPDASTDAGTSPRPHARPAAA